MATVKPVLNFEAIETLIAVLVTALSLKSEIILYLKYLLALCIAHCNHRSCSRYPASKSQNHSLALIARLSMSRRNQEGI